MSTVRWPSARCSRTRRMPAGNDLVRMQVAEHLGRRPRRAGRPARLVAPVEVAEEVAAVAPVEGEQRRGLGQRPQREAEPVVAGEAPGGQPRVRGHDVRGDEGVLEVEGGEVAVGRQHLARGAGRPRSRPSGRRRSVRTRACCDHRRQVDVVDVGGPVDDPGVEAERRLVGVVERARSGRAGGRRRRSPRTRRRRRRARRSRGPARPPPASPRAGPTTRPACPAGAGAGGPSRPARGWSWPGSSWPWTRPRPGNDHSGTTIGWPSLSYSGCSVNQPATRSTSRR